MESLKKDFSDADDFVRSYFGTNEPLISGTFFPHF